MYRTLSVYAANHAERMTLIGQEHATGDERYARAFVDEELRTDQSERLMRRVLTDISFEGWHLPAGSLARVCMWESHHDPDLFPQPMRFDPDRFSGSSKGSASASIRPDRHPCPFADLVEVAGIRFLRALTHFDLRSQGDQTMMRGAYHWEPGHDFSLQIRRRNAG
jgi:cytochrome P450